MSATIPFSLFDINTRRILPGKMNATTIQLVDLCVQGNGPDVSYVLGHHNWREFKVDENGEVVPLTEEEKEATT